MREVVIRAWCDECNVHGQHTEGEAVDILWAGRAYTLDLCEEHIEPFRLVGELVARHGVVTKRSKKSHAPKKPSMSAVYRQPDGQYKCPDCGRLITNAQGLAAHRRQTHGLGAPEPVK